MRLLFAVLALFALSGCLGASSGQNFSEAGATQITEGMSEAQVLQLLGSEPNSVSYMNGRRVLIWSYAAANLIGQNHQKSIGVGMLNGHVEFVNTSYANTSSPYLLAPLPKSPMQQ